MNRLLFLAAAVAMAQQPPSEPTFRAGTRLVEVEVVVRDHQARRPGAAGFLRDAFVDGPPFGPPGPEVGGLTENDFTLLDEGLPQRIAVFRAGASTDSKAVPLPPGAVSNRQDSQGQPLSGVTAVLIDLLNTDFDMTEYARLGVTNFLRSLSAADSRVALYTLGQNLHVLHDFTDDPQKLMGLASALEKRHGSRPADLAAAFKDYGDLLDLGRDEVHGRMTTKALTLIIQHLSGAPGRKNLIWLMDDPSKVPPAVMGMARQANIVLYPVVTRTVPQFWKQAAARKLAAVTGATAFFDSLDLTFAVHTAEEDTRTTYVLGYYPAQETLDGKYHKIEVRLHDMLPDKQPLEIHYRPGYLATKVELPPPPPPPEQLFQGLVNSALIGLTAQAALEVAHPGLYDLRVTVDLHDIHFERQNGRFIGSFDLSVPNPASKGTVKTAPVNVDLNDAQFAQGMERGFKATVTALEPQFGEIRVVVRDRATGAAGSLRVPVPKP